MVYATTNTVIVPTKRVNFPLTALRNSLWLDVLMRIVDDIVHHGVYRIENIDQITLIIRMMNIM